MSSSDDAGGTGAPHVHVEKDGDAKKPSAAALMFRKVLRFLVSRLAGVLLVGIVVATHVLDVAPIPLLNRSFYDHRMRARGERAPSSDVALVTIDDEAIRELGRWPWPRSVFADLIAALDKAGARVVAIDVGFLEPDAYSARSVMSTVRKAVDTMHIENTELTGLLDKLGEEADTDARLARVIGDAKTQVVLGYYFFNSPEQIGYEPSEDERREYIERIRPSAFFEEEELGPDSLIPESVTQAWLPQPPIRELAKATRNHGYLLSVTDVDGAIRRASLMMECEGHIFPSLALAAARAFRGGDELHVHVTENGVEGIELGASTIPTDPMGGILVNYHGPPPVFPRYSAADVIAGRVPAGTLDGKLIVVGGTANGIRDDFRTPVGTRQNGVEIRATVIDNILQKQVLMRHPSEEIFGVLFLIGLGLAAVLAIPALPTFVGLLLTGVAGVVVYYADASLFAAGGSYLPVVPSVLCLILIFSETLLRRYMQERDRRQQVEGTFGRYVAPTVVEAMLSDPDKLQLGGEERRLTVLFSDLAGFTATTEKLSPSEMVALMCEYFEEMTAKIYDQEGMLKEYVGDEIMALFGAPVFHQDHAVRACRAALAMHDRLQVLRQEWMDRGRPPLNARWGVNTGTMLVGNLGSSYRFSYGALGDSVNLGSRLEGLNNQYGSRILIGEETAEDVKDVFVLREVDAVRVKGKSKVVRVHELLGEAGTPVVADWAGDLETYASALARYREAKFERAKELFEKLLARRPEDGPALTMRGRCIEYLEAPPPEGWDGTYTATKK